MSPTMYFWPGSQGSVSQYSIMDSIIRARLPIAVKSTIVQYIVKSINRKEMHILEMFEIFINIKRNHLNLLMPNYVNCN